jgi:hypothetical protein
MRRANWQGKRFEALLLMPREGDVHRVPIRINETDSLSAIHIIETVAIIALVPKSEVSLC